MMDPATPPSPNQTQTPTHKGSQALHSDAQSWKKLWQPTSDQASTKKDPLPGDRPGQRGLLKGSAIFLGFLCFFLGGAAGIAHWQTGLLGVAKGPSYGKASVLFNAGFQAFYYEAGQEIWIDYTTGMEEGFFKISIWTTDKLFSWNRIDKVFEYEVTQSETREITWRIPQSGYYRIVFSSGKGKMPDLFGSTDRWYSAKYGIKRIPSYQETLSVPGKDVEGQTPAPSEGGNSAP